MKNTSLFFSQTKEKKAVERRQIFFFPLVFRLFLRSSRSHRFYGVVFVCFILLLLLLLLLLLCNEKKEKRARDEQLSLSLSLSLTHTHTLVSEEKSAAEEF